MSTFVQEQVTCACGNVTARDLATSINVSRTPEWRGVILDGTFQRFACPTCGMVAESVIPFIYVDFDRRHYVGVFPIDDEAHWRELEDEPLVAFERNLGAGAPAIARPLGEGFLVRTVFGLDALREKLVILDADLDDTFVEILKLRLLVARTDVVPIAANRLRLVAADATHLTLVDPVGEHTVVDRSDYDAIGEDPVLVNDLGVTLAAGPYLDAGRVLAT
jgi:hypothetical protein